MDDGRRKRTVRRFFLGLTVAALPVGVGQLAGCNGRVTGVEYSPDLLCHRSFRYWAVCGCQVSLKETEAWRSDLDQFFLDEGYVGSEAKRPARWWFSKGFAPGVRGWHGKAKHTCFSLGCFSDRDREWVDWSRQKPNLAEALWPTVITWIREERVDDIIQLLIGHQENLLNATEVEDVVACIVDAEKEADP